MWTCRKPLSLGSARCYLPVDEDVEGLWIVSRRPVELGPDLAQDIRGFRALLGFCLDTSMRVEHGGVVAIAERGTDRREGRVRQLSRKVHGDLTSEGDVWSSVMGQKGLA